MTGLEVRVTEFVGVNPGLTAREIAKGVRGGYQTVRAILDGPQFYSSEVERDGGRGLRTALGYGLLAPGVTSAAEALRDATNTNSATQCARILSVLSDGEWHSSAEIHSKVFCVLHSRVAELRRRDHTILHSGGGGGAENHFYLWVREDVAEVAA